MAKDVDSKDWRGSPALLQCYTTGIIDLSKGAYTNDDLKFVVEHVLEHQHCRELVLHHNHLTAAGAFLLAELLRKNSSLQKLNVGYNDIGDEGVRLLAAALSTENRTLAKLHLQSTGVTEVGAGYLAEMLRVHPKMRKLGLDYNAVGDEGVRLLALALSSDPKVGAPLRALYLDCNKISDEGISHLSDMLEINRTITGLALAINQISDSGVKRLIETLLDYNSKITGISLFSNGRITDASLPLFLKLFSQSRKFTMYKLYDCGFSPAAEKRLRTATAHVRGLQLLLQGDGFDLHLNNRWQRVEISSSRARDPFDNWCANRQKNFGKANADHQRAVEVIPEVRSNGTPKNDPTVSCATDMARLTIGTDPAETESKAAVTTKKKNPWKKNE